MKSVVLLLLLSFCAVVRAPCPFETRIHPCTCESSGADQDEVVHVVCPDIDNIWNLILIIKNLKGYPGFFGTKVDEFTITNSTAIYLKDDLFDELSVKIINLKSSTFLSLSNCETAFKGLEDTLEGITIEDCSFMNSWKWGKLKNMKKLTRIEVKSGDLLIVDEDLAELSHLNIKVLSFDNNFISWVHDEAFAKFSGLVSISLSHNDMETFKRSMFPSPAAELRIVDVSYNNIQNLPTDMFTNMPKLTDVNLNYNNILVLKEEVYSSLWNKLEAFGAIGNPLSCDCRIIWLTEKKFEGKTHRATCSQPHRLKGRFIDSLQKSELWC